MDTKLKVKNTTITRDEIRRQRKKKLGLKRQIVILIWCVVFAWLSVTSDSASFEEENPKENINPSRSIWVNPPDKSKTAAVGLRSRRAVVMTEGDKGNNVTGGDEGFPSVNILKAEINGSVPTSLPSNTTPPTTTTTSTSSISFSSTTTTIGVLTSTTAEGLDDLVPGLDCTLPGITEFPPDLFTQTQRRQGYLAIHFLASIYVFYALALVCDDYFVPSIECICEEMHLPSDVAGATFMAIATSSPELFTNVIGTFITEGDLGVGTIVGSAVFNILAVGACCGLAAQTALPLEWYPLTRDCIFYSFSVILLIVVLNNRQVFWYEALVLVIAYAVYIFVMYKNTAIKNKVEGFVETLRKAFRTEGESSAEKSNFGSDGRVKKNRSRRSSFVAELTSSSERTPLLGGEDGLKSRTSSLTSSYSQSYEKSKQVGKIPWEKDEEVLRDQEDDDITAQALDEMLIAKALHNLENAAEDDKDGWALFTLPEEKSVWILFQWISSWPARFVLTFTVPDCRESRLRKWYPITFLMCIVWIALLSYVVSWMMTIIGHTLRIPDSVMGLTFIAAGTSVPEAVSSIIVARQGLGTMSLSNSIGSNTFDILMCLGLPWLVKGAMIAKDPKNFILINSGGLEYSAMILMVSLILFYTLLAVNKFYLDKKVGIIFLCMYAAFLVFASLFEMNVFITVNLPTCLIVE